VVPYRRLPAFAASFACFVALPLLLAACGGGSDGNGPRFLLARPGGLSELRGAREKQIFELSQGAYLLDPAISPDGTHLAFGVQPPAGTKPGGGADFGSDLYISKRDGSESREVAHHASVGEFITSPAWLSQNELIFSVSGRDKAGLPDIRIETLNIDTGDRKRAFDWGVKLDLSEDRRSLVFVYLNPEEQVETLKMGDITSKQEKEIVPTEAGLAFISSPVFSPDAKRIAFAAANPGVYLPGYAGPNRYASVLHPTLQDVWTINADGTGLKRLSELAESALSLTWSEDGAFVYALGSQGFLQIDASTGNSKRIGDGLPQGQIRLLPRR
jgi:hypothetical protein